MERRQFARYYDQISRAIQAGLELPDRDLPAKKFSTRVPSLGMLGQFLTTAMNVVCHQNKIAPGVFATTSELRMVAAWHLGMTKKPQNRLTSGWRRDLLEPILKGILDGKIGIRVEQPNQDAPLVLFQIDES
jgi:ribonuclease D